MLIIDSLINAIKNKKNPTAIGLDTCAEYLPSSFRNNLETFKTISQKIFEFNKTIIDETGDLVPCVKVQVAYYEMYAEYGMEAFRKTLEYANDCKLITIADVKRNDILSTAQAYSKAYLSPSDIDITAYHTDFITVNPYLGSDGIQPFVDDCKKYNKGLFVLVKTSNKSSIEIQNEKLETGKFVYELIGDLTENWGSSIIGDYGYSSVGAVVGATQSFEISNLRKQHPSLFFLLPGYGSQGATAKDLLYAFDSNENGAIINNSRGIICAHKKFPDLPYYTSARNAVLDMKKDINNFLYCN